MEPISRDKYVSKIIPFIKNDIIKVLVGQRRVGKSYMLDLLINYIKSHYPDSKIIDINLELNAYRHLRNADDLYLYIKDNSDSDTYTFVFIDEIQEVHGFEEALRTLKAERHYDLYITGSNAHLLSGELATYLSGRYVQFYIHGLSYDEFLRFHNLENSNESLMKYIRYGGMPYLKNLNLDDEPVYGYLKSIYNTIILRDVIARHGIRNIDFLEHLIKYLADSMGSLLSAKKISDYLKSQQVKISVKVVLEYLKYLEDAFFIHRVRRFDIQGKKLFELNDKFFFTDIGLRNCIISYNLKDIGKIMENLVYNKLITSGYDVYVGKLGNREVDFVAEKQDVTIYLQVAYLLPDEKVYEREFGNLLDIQDNHRKIVISMDEFIGSNYKGIEHVHLRSFLASEI